MNFRKYAIRIIVVALGLVSGISQAQNLPRQYTKEHPLVYEDAWDLWPYVFLNEFGEPEGFNIDMLKLLFDKLDIPYVIRLKPTNIALQDLKEGRSDLMLGMAAPFHNDYATYGREVVQLFTHSIVSSKSLHRMVYTLDDISSHQVIVHTGSFSHHLIEERGWAFNCQPYGDMKEAIQRVISEGKGEIVWNTVSLTWLMRKFHTTDLQIAPINIPHGEYRFMSNDTLLLHKLDSAFAQLRSSEQMAPLLNKWFYPERKESGIPDWVQYVAAVVGVLAFLLLYYVIGLRIRERRMTRLIAKHNRRLALILHTTKVRVLLYDVKRQRLSWMNAKGEMDPQEHTFDDYRHLYSQESYDLLTSALNAIVGNRQDTSVVEITRKSEADHRRNVITLAVFRRTKRGTPSVIVGIIDDQTERLLQRHEAGDNLLRYRSIFSTSMIDMTYYNTEGLLTDINQKACTTFNCNREDLLAERVPFTYALEDPSVTLEEFDGCYSSHIIKAENNPNLADNIKILQTIYYEQQLVPVYDADDRFLGIVGSGRDVSEFVNSYHQLKRSIKKMMSAAIHVTDYINNINYALHAGGVRLVSYSPNTHILTIYKEMNVVQLTLTQSRCLSLIDDESRRKAIRLMNNMDQHSSDSIEAIITTNVRVKQHQRLSVLIDMIPVYGNKGEVESYFGLCRDVSNETETAKELEREKAKAQEVESVKNAFVRNMSHEIRTPITTVVGFAELFATDHDPADEPGFIAEIKSNASYLLKLVNDILFLSRLDAHMIEFRKTATDFAITFEAHCQMGWSQNQKSGVNYIVESPYEHLIVEIDDSNVGKIIGQVAENAARYTEQGFVRARYDHIGDQLLISIEDTGCGISAEQQQMMFERFGASFSGNSTGLGMPICKELAQQMGGSIYVNSAPEKGTTVWIIIPCKAIQTEKKLSTY